MVRLKLTSITYKCQWAKLSQAISCDRCALIAEIPLHSRLGPSVLPFCFIRFKLEDLRSHISNLKFSHMQTWKRTKEHIYCKNLKPRIEINWTIRCETSLICITTTICPLFPAQHLEFQQTEHAKGQLKRKGFQDSNNRSKTIKFMWIKYWQTWIYRMAYTAATALKIPVTR